MSFTYSSKLFGGIGAGGSGVGTSLTTQVLFNASGAVAGDAGLTYDAATDTLTVGGKLVTSRWELDSASNLGMVNTSSAMYIGAARPVVWTNGTPGDPADSGLRRVSAGLVGVTDGSTGKGNLNLGIPAYADNAAALAGGLVAGTLYYTDVAGEYIVKVAH